jgi:hypothetical protein
MRALIPVLFAIAALSACADIRPAPGDTGIGFADATKAFTEALSTAKRVEVYEGLPNPFGERVPFEDEKKAKDCREIAGEWFYSRPQAGQAGLAAELQRLFDAGLFKPWRGMKLCGGFHADYAVMLVTGSKTVQVLFCFGCHEARIRGVRGMDKHPDGTTEFQLTTDLDAKTYDALRALLEAYRKERPARVIKPSGSQTRS